MSNPRKEKGSAYERLIVGFLRDKGFEVDRTRAGWVDDRGDIHGIDGVVFECKNHKRLDLSGWVAELASEMANAKSDMGVVVHKKRGTNDPAQQYATLPLGLFVDLLRRAGYK